MMCEVDGCVVALCRVLVVVDHLLVPSFRGDPGCAFVVDGGKIFITGVSVV